METSAGIILALLMAGVTLTGLLFFDSSLLRNLIIIGGWVLMVVFLATVPKIRYERYRYCIDDEAIRVRWGLFWLKEQIVPIERLHKVALSQGPIDRAFDLSSVKVTTAGGDLVIKFLNEEKAADIAELLKKKINDIAIAERARH